MRNGDNVHVEAEVFKLLRAEQVRSFFVIIKPQLSLSAEDCRVVACDGLLAMVLNECGG